VSSRVGSLYFKVPRAARRTCQDPFWINYLPNRTQLLTQPERPNPPATRYSTLVASSETSPIARWHVGSSAAYVPTRQLLGVQGISKSDRSVQTSMDACKIRTVSSQIICNLRLQSVMVMCYLRLHITMTRGKR
jgi:hypothetical protein